jgi:hypothetical protein
MKKIILADRYDANIIIQEEKEYWVIEMLLLLGVKNDEIENINHDALYKCNIQVWDCMDNGDVEIKKENILVAKWYAPKLLPKYNSDNSIYYEIHLDYDSIFENNILNVGDNSE